MSPICAADPIDLVVVGAKSRLAIECDGDAWHGPSAYEADLARQRDLERCGWEFFRIRESAFYVDQAAAMSGLWDTLNELNIHPSGWLSDEVGSDPEDTEEPDAASEESSEILAWEEESSVTHPQSEEQRGETDEALVGPHADDPQPSVADINGSPPLDDSTATIDELVSDISFDGALALSWGSETDLPEYVEYTGQTVQPLATNREAIIAGLKEIVSVEGPIVGHRLHGAYVRAAGGQRVGKQVAKMLNSAISTAVRQGHLVADDPLDEAGVRPRTYRLPSQQETKPRQLGPRTLEQVPPSELATHFAEAAQTLGWDNDETLFRAVLSRLGLRRLTSNVELRLGAVLPFAREGAAPRLGEHS